MVRTLSLVLGLTLSQVAWGQANPPAPAPQQHVSLWVSHSIQYSIQGANFRILAQEYPTQAAYFNTQSKVLYDTYVSMRGTAPRDPGYRQFLAACDAYHHQLWGLVGAPAVVNDPDRGAIMIVNSNVQMQLLHYQIKTIGGRLRTVPPVDALPPVQAVAADTTVSGPVKQLASLATTVIQLSQSLIPVVGTPSREAEYKAALNQILGISGGALGVPVAPVAAPAMHAAPNPLPGNGRLDAPR